MSRLQPDYYIPHITGVTLEFLRRHGIRGLILDVDNTLTRHRSQYLDPDVEIWLAEMQAAGYALTVVSNSDPGRVRPFAQRIGLRCISFSCKPAPFGFWRAARRLGLPLNQCAAVGDQVFTDILGAHAAGVKSIQVMPIELETGKPLMQLKRRIEKRIIAKHKQDD